MTVSTRPRTQIIRELNKAIDALPADSPQRGELLARLLKYNPPRKRRKAIAKLRAEMEKKYAARAERQESRSPEVDGNGSITDPGFLEQVYGTHCTYCAHICHVEYWERGRKADFAYKIDEAGNCPHGIASVACSECHRPFCCDPHCQGLKK